MKAIFKRELKSYFTTPLGYVLLAVFAGLSTIGFIYYCLGNYYDYMDYVFTFIMQWVLMFFCPMLTMKLFSDEQRSKTDQLLLTSKTSVTGIVLGKYLSASVFYAISLSITVIFEIIVLANSSAAKLPIFIGNFIATLFVGMAFIAIGMFISSLTENQIIAAFATFGVVLAFYLLDMLVKSNIASVLLSTIVGAVSIYGRYSNFALGLFDIEAAIYYVTIIALFCFLTARSIEKRRYS